MRSLVRYGVLGMLAMAAGCGSDVSPMEQYPDGGAFDAAPAIDAVDALSPVDPSGVPHLYVVSAIDVPTTAQEATALGLDIDGDPSGEVDNKLGEILGTLASLGGNDPQAYIDARLADGSIIQLINVRATGLTDAIRVGFSLFVGEDSDDPPNPADNFSGTEMFNLSPTAPTDSLLAGAITAGHLSAYDGSMPLLISIVEGVDPVLLNLVGARVEADVVADGITAGRLAGGIRSEQVLADIYPALEQAFALTVAADCVGTTCTPMSAGATLLNLFDFNDDGVITLAELEESTILGNLFAPDMDLFDAEGFYNPNDDGVLDTLSFGVGFTAVNAIFVPPAQ